MQLQKKWKNIRDSYTRELSKQKCIKSGSRADNRRQYIFFNQLSFLSPVCETRPPDEEAKANEESEEYAQKRLRNTSKVSKRPRSEEQKLYEVLAESVQLKASAIKEDDPEKHFLLSLVPDLKCIPQHLQIDAKCEIMSVLIKYKYYNPTNIYEHSSSHVYSSGAHTHSATATYPGASSYQTSQYGYSSVGSTPQTFINQNCTGSSAPKHSNEISSPPSVVSNNSESSMYGDLFQE